MQVFLLDKGNFLISKNSENYYLLSVSSEEQNITFKAREVLLSDNFPKCYKKVYDIEELYDAHNYFKALKTPKEILDELEKIFSNGNFEIQVFNDIFFLYLLGDIIVCDFKILIDENYAQKALLQCENKISCLILQKKKLEMTIRGIWSSISQLKQNLKKLENENSNLLKNEGELVKRNKKLQDNICSFTGLEATMGRIKHDIKILNRKDTDSKITNEEDLEFREIKEFYGHKSAVNSLISLKKGRVASCSYDKTINIYDLKSEKKEFELKGHKGSVVSMCELETGLIISASTDKDLKVWGFKDNEYKVFKTIIAHSDYINKVICINNKRFCSCSWDTTIKIWSSESFSIVKTLIGHTDKVVSIIETQNKKLISSSCGKDNTLRVWDVFSYSCEKVIQDIPCSSWNGLVEVPNDLLIVGKLNGVTIVNLADYTVEKRISDDKFGFINSITSLKGGKILCCGECEFEIENLDYEYKMKEKYNNKSIYSVLKFNEETIMYGFSDGSIRIVSI